MDNPQDYSPERLADRARIQDVMFRWCRAVDRLDLEAIRSVFHPDAIDAHGMYHGSIPGLIDWIQKRHENIPFSMHMLGNMLIEFAAPDTALVETYVFVVQRYPAEGTGSLVQFSGGVEAKPGTAVDLMACARYVDRFDRRNGEWRIGQRTVVYDPTMMVEVSENAPRMRPEFVVGARDNSDYIYQARAQLGL